MIFRSTVRAAGAVPAVAIVAAAIMLTAGDDRASAQISTASSRALRQEIERRFDVLPLHNGIALRPKSQARALRIIRSIELTDGTIAIDGVLTSGAELRDKLGSDADLVLRLSYLDDTARRALFGTSDLLEPAEAPDARDPMTPAVAPATPPDLPSVAPRRHPRTRHSDDRVRIGGSVTVDADESVNDVVVIGGSAHIQGEVTGDLVVIGGFAELGPHAEVGKDITVVGGRLRRDPDARVRGRVNEIGPGINLRGLQFGHLPFNPDVFFWGSRWFGLFAFLSTVMRVVILCVLASLIVLVGHDYVERISARAAAEPLKAGVVGFLAQLLIVPLLVVTIVVLVVTIIGIPFLVLIPFAILGLIALCVVGFTAVAYHVGRLVAGRIGSAPLNPYLTAMVGIVVVMLPVLLGRMLGIGGAHLLPIALPILSIGFLAEYLAWTVGLGAVALNRFDRRAG